MYLYLYQNVNAIYCMLYIYMLYDLYFLKASVDVLFLIHSIIYLNKKTKMSLLLILKYSKIFAKPTDKM